MSLQTYKFACPGTIEETGEPCPETTEDFTIDNAMEVGTPMCSECDLEMERIVEHTFWILFVNEYCEPGVEGPYDSEEDATAAAKKLCADEEAEGSNGPVGVYRLYVDEHGIPSAGIFTGHEVETTDA